MTEFKQIIGRGTRLLEDYGKTYFTIMDFRNVSRLFADPAFDGMPEAVEDITGDEEVTEPMDMDENIENPSIDGHEIITEPPFIEDDYDEADDAPKKYYVDDVAVSVISERVQYLDSDGKLITESLVDYTKKNIVKQYAKLDEFLRTWTEAEKKRAIIDELEANGVFLDAVREETGQEDLDDFDLICHLAYDKPPL